MTACCGCDWVSVAVTACYSPLSLSSLPDILALSSAEVQLPTLNMSSSELGDISLSGLINTIIAPEQADQVHHQIQNVSQKYCHDWRE